MTGPDLLSLPNPAKLYPPRKKITPFEDFRKIIPAGGHLTPEYNAHI